MTRHCFVAGLLALIVCSSSLAVAQTESYPPFRVAVTLQVTPEVLKDRAQRFLGNALRSLGDVEVVDVDDEKDFELILVILASYTTEDQPSGYFFGGFVVRSVLENTKHLLWNRLERGSTTSEDVPVQDTPEWQWIEELLSPYASVEYFWVGTRGVVSIKEVCESTISTFNAEVLEKHRKRR